MKLVKTIEEMRAFRNAVRKNSKRLGLVPTMGALHEGHLSLVRAARDKSDIVAVSIFVNPTQFGPNEDFAKYPRNLESDSKMLEREHVDVIFAPSVDDMYPPGAMTWVTVEGISDRLCGKSRPGHFRGVTTIVSKLFHIIEPDAAFFGQKDAAQVAIIRRMVRDLNMPVEIEVGEIIRESDGLALSSRNAYLDPQERKSALVLHRSLQDAQRLFETGERNSEKLIAVGKQEFAGEPCARLDYFEIIDPDSLEPVTTIENRTLIAVAAFIGNTRLIDNIIVDPHS
ncbi:MAG TPA: pantoate--beta-alanine ligase [Terriglobales bacterium]|jgi:pantoate--beta-alanine ligase|nr:pantoate--beta-alanine ligase [Terriglobales bacterium]